MKYDVNKNFFMNEFSKIRPDSFSYYGLDALYDYLIEREEDLGIEEEFDVIALDSMYREYESFSELKKDYVEIETINDLYKKTTVIPFEDNGIIIEEF